MNSARITGRLVGALLLALLPTGLIVPYVLLQPLGTAPAGFLESAARMAPIVRASVFMLSTGGALSLAISIALWPSVRSRSTGLALWVLALALANFVLQLTENGHWLTMLSVSQAYREAGPSAAASFGAAGVAVRSAWKWAHYSHIFVVVAWLFSLFLLLFVTRFVPRALAALGMALAVLHFDGITLPVFAGFRMPYPALFGMPLGFGILAVAVWLLIRGLPEPLEATSPTRR